MKKNKLFAGALGLLALGTIFIIAAETKAQPANLFADPVVAKGKGFTVKQSQVDDAFVAFKAEMAARGQPVPDSQRAEVEKRIVDQLVVMEILRAKATPDDTTKAGQAADRIIANAKTQAPSEEAFNRQLQARGMTPEQFETKIKERAVVEEVLERELKSQVEVSDAEAKKFYEENPERFEQPEMVRASHILLTTVDPATRQELPEEQKKAKREKVEKILQQAKAGEDFAKLAREFSEDPGSKETGGEYTFPKGQMVPEFEATAFNLQPSEISGVVTTQFGYHIIKLSEKIPAKKAAYNEVSERIKDFLEQQEVRKQLPDYLEKLKAEANVEILEAGKP